MSRSKHFITGLLTGYAALGINVLYTLASVPLALHYLSKEEFGLWALITQLSGYLLLLEFGMSGSVARFLSDHKDNVDGGEYGSVLRTGCRVFLFQGVLVAVLGIVAASLAPAILNLPIHLHSTFRSLATIQALLAAASLATRGAGAPLWPHQRNDIINFMGSLNLVVSFITLWICYHLGWKLYSFIAASSISIVTNNTVSIYNCHRLSIYPKKGCWGRYDAKLFRQMFHYGRGLFMLNLGTQLVSSSQIIIVSRMLGLEAASVWAVSTKLSTMASQFVLKVFDSSAAGLTELYVRGENERLMTRFRDVMTLTSVLGAVAGIGISWFNGPLIEIWTSGKISWSEVNNLLMGGLVFITCITRAQIGMVSLHKDLAWIKYMTIAEGLLFIAAAVLFCPYFGFSAILISSIACNLVSTGWYAITRSADYFGLPFLTVAGWGRNSAILLMLTAPFHYFYLGISPRNSANYYDLGITSIAFLFFVLPTGWWFAVPSHMKREIKDRVNKTRLTIIPKKVN